LHYFPSKEALILALLDERDASIEADLLELLASKGFDEARHSSTKLAIFRESLANVVRIMVRSPDLIRLHVVLRAEAIDPAHPASSYFKQRDRGTLTWLAQRAAPFSVDAQTLARCILATMIGLQQLWLQEGMMFDLVEEWRAALDRLLPDSADTA
jgi:AcrR family transcriptional regulator